MEKLKEIKYILFHPEDGFTTMHYKKTGSALWALVSAFCWFLVALISKQYKNFRFNDNYKENFNILYTVLGTVVIFIAFTVANWAVCTLFDGEGSYREIFIVCGYAIIPYWVSLALGVILSYFLSIDEAMFMGIISTIGILYAAFMLVIGLVQIHDYTFFKTILSIFFTIIGVALIIFMCFLIITLFQELFNFIKSVVQELLMRNFV